ncbi:hypothetical protein [Pontiella sulfatireligans]|uniref:PEP-CTERM protein-sorting domain-containing protein n=1 Tax=Pontiella sulfatireligans TaxID=2750658 RepID=A0A6C2UP77_9BACT|nr:hypothetical protein [Pontiella sulfatireligans]VGO21879.1 hypothetical protein SCARR_03959 [Pontiella sulfatireligans]
MTNLSRNLFGCLALCCLLGQSVMSQDILATWENGSLTPTLSPVASLGATLTLDTAADAYAAGSTDGTYGAFGSGADTGALSFRLQTDHAFTLTVANHTSSNAVLDAIRFDFVRRFNDSPENILVSYESGNLDAGPVPLLSTNVLNNSTETGDYPDFDVLLSPSLNDTELAPTESAVFSIVISGGAATRTPLLLNQTG